MFNLPLAIGLANKELYHAAVAGSAKCSVVRLLLADSMVGDELDISTSNPVNASPSTTNSAGEAAFTPGLTWIAI